MKPHSVSRLFIFNFSTLVVLISALLCSISLTTRSYHQELWCLGLVMSVLSAALLWHSHVRQSRVTARRTYRIIEVKNRLHRQHEALLKISSSKQLFEKPLAQAFSQINELVARTLVTSHCSIWTSADDLATLNCEDLFNRDLETHASKITLNLSKDPRFAAALSQKRILAIENPTEFNFFREAPLTHYSVMVALAAPIFIEGKRCGLVLVWDQKKHSRWKIDELDFVASIADFTSILFEAQRHKVMQGELQRRSHAIDSAMDGIAILNAEECFSYVNPAHAALYGYSSPENLIGKNWRVLYSKSERTRFEKEIIPTMRREGKATVEARGLRSDGSTFFQEVSLSTLSEGGLICVVRDISHKRLIDQRITESQNFLRNVIDSDPNFIFVKNAQGKFTLVNQAVAEAYGTTVEAIVGKSDSDFNPRSDEVETFRNDDLRVIKSRKEITISEERITDCHGKVRYLQTIKRPLEVGPLREVHVLGVSSDITKHKQLHEQLLQSQKLEAVGQLAGGVAHDFNNLLTAILGYTASLKMLRPAQHEVVTIATHLENTAQLAGQLTQKLLGFARKGKHQNSPIDLHASIQETLAILNRTIERSINISLHLLADETVILGDPVQIQQLILNLVLNARDAVLDERVPAGRAQITISSKVVDFDAAQMPPGKTLSHGHYIELSIRDTGCGMSAETQRRVFEPFFTTKETGKGSGMGLAMVYGIAECHGGCVTLKSDEGQGSTFSIYLPLRPVISLPTTQSSNLTRSLIKENSQHAQILLVDDHKEVREVTARMLSSLGYQVFTARDGVEAVAFFKENRTMIDLVILDMVMPRMGARECFRKIRSLNPGVRTILSTGYVNNNTVQEILDEGMTGFVQKPYHLVRLSEVVASALR